MNNNIGNLVNEVSSRYGLGPDYKQVLLNKFATDSRDINTISNELNIYASYYRYQSIINNAIRVAPPLSDNNNYYISTFDNSGKMVLQGVNVTDINKDKNEVMINNLFKGNMKHSQVDEIEVCICQIGKYLNFDIVEEYMLYDANKNKNSIVIRDIINDDEFYDAENLKNRMIKLVNGGKLRKTNWQSKYDGLSVANVRDDYKVSIDYGLNVIKNLPSIREDDYKEIEKKYFDMIIFDSLINQSERNMVDYGIICDKETRRYSFAPLFDNVFPTILKNNNVIYFNGITCNRYELMETLIYDYYDKVSDRIEYLINNKDNIIKNIDIICKYNLSLANYIMLTNNIKGNIEYFEKLIKEKELTIRNENAGFVDVATMTIVLVIIVIFSIAIGYLLYCIN